MLSENLTVLGRIQIMSEFISCGQHTVCLCRRPGKSYRKKCQDFVLILYNIRYFIAFKAILAQNEQELVTDQVHKYQTRFLCLTVNLRSFALCKETCISMFQT